MKSDSTHARKRQERKKERERKRAKKTTRPEPEMSRNRKRARLTMSKPASILRCICRFRKGEHDAGSLAAAAAGVVVAHRPDGELGRNAALTSDEAAPTGGRHRLRHISAPAAAAAAAAADQYSAHRDKSSGRARQPRRTQR